METDTYQDTATSRPSDLSDGGRNLNGQHFRKLRKSRKLSQHWVASKCGCSVSLISKWEKGTYSPSGEILCRITCTASEIETLKIDNSKYCWRCQTLKQVSLFGRDLSRPNGYQSKCLACNNEVVKVWRKANRTAFTDYKRVKYKIKTSGSRQAGYKWVNGDKRSLQEVQLLGARNELSLRKEQFRCSPIKKSEERKSAFLVSKNNQIFIPTQAPDDRNDSLVESFLDFYGRRIKHAYDSGRITEVQSKKLAHHISIRSPDALEQYWKTLDVSDSSIQT